MHALRHRLLQIGVVEDDVGRLAAQLLRHALDGIGRGLRHRDTGARRTRERHHIDARMRRHRLAHRRAVAIDEIEHAGGNARFVHDLGEQIAAHGRDFAGLQHHRAPGGQRGRDFAGDLVDRPVPRRDQSAHADRLANDFRRAACFLEIVILQDTHGLAQMAEARCGLRGFRETQRRAHLARNGLDHFGVMLLIGVEDFLQERKAFFLRRAREGLERAPSRGDRFVDIGLGAQADAGIGLFIGRIDDIERLGRDGVDPFAVDIEISACPAWLLPLFCCGAAG